MPIVVGNRKRRQKYCLKWRKNIFNMV